MSTTFPISDDYVYMITVIDNADFGKVLWRMTYRSEPGCHVLGELMRDYHRKQRRDLGETDEVLIEAITYDVTPLRFIDE